MQSPDFLTSRTISDMLERMAAWAVDGADPSRRRLLAGACARISLLILTPADIAQVLEYCGGSTLAEGRCMRDSVAVSKELDVASAYDMIRVMGDISSATMDPRLAKLGCFLCLLSVPWVSEEELPTVAAGVAQFAAAMFATAGGYFDDNGGEGGVLTLSDRIIARANMHALVRMEYSNWLAQQNAPAVAGA